MRLLKHFAYKAIGFVFSFLIIFLANDSSVIAYVISSECGSFGSCNLSCCTGGCWAYPASQCSYTESSCDRKPSVPCESDLDCGDWGPCNEGFYTCSGSRVPCGTTSCSANGRYCETSPVSCHLNGYHNEICTATCTCPALTSTPIPTATPRPTATLAPGQPSPTSRPDCPQSSTWFCENAGSSCPASCTTHSEYKCGNDGPCCGDCPPAVIPSDTPTPTPTFKLYPELASGHTDHLCSSDYNTGDSNSGCANDSCYTNIDVVDRGEWLSARRL